MDPVLAQLGAPDMRTAIGYALSFRAVEPARRAAGFRQARGLDFEAPDEMRFPRCGFAPCDDTPRRVQGAVLNGAREVALEAFIEGRLSFLAMADITERVMDDLASLPAADMDSLRSRQKARQQAAGLMKAAIARVVQGSQSPKDRP